MQVIEEYSVSALPIVMFFNSTELGLGTGFIWKRGAQHLLITNWHTVTGRDPNTGVLWPPPPFLARMRRSTSPVMSRSAASVEVFVDGCVL